MVRIGIIGAGISGLSTGFHLARLLDEKKIEFTLDVFEKEKRPGGNIQSLEEEGFLVEGGPNGFLDSRPSTLELCDALHISLRLLPSNASAKRRYILLKDALRLVPEKPGKFLKSPLLSFKGKARVFMEGMVKKGASDKDETIAEFGKRRIGQEAVDNLLDPMVTGIFAGDPAVMSLRACFPRIWEMEQTYGSLTRALIHIMRKRKTSGPAGPGGTLISFPEGTQYLTQRLADEKSLNLKLGTEITKVDYSGGKWFVDKNSNLPYDLLVSASPSYVLAGLLKDIAPLVAEKAAQISYSPMAVLGMGFKKKAREGKIDGFGFLIPHKEKRKILGALFSSQIFSGRSPEGYELLQVMAGGARFPEIAQLSDKEILDFSIEEIRSILGIESKPDFVKIFRFRRAIPLYRTGHLALIDQLKKALEPLHGIFLTGNAFYGVGINDCTTNSLHVARAAVSYLTGDRND